MSLSLLSVRILTYFSFCLSAVRSDRVATLSTGQGKKNEIASFPKQLNRV
ncbi:hypothetical protein C789_819 [Microcystis aeruginosa FACHB-905 = DIANCHI905]|nr:hypothetical protein C789_819 [Microcystis aeruginosa FACHB-905 = DIANCHI905]